MQHLFKCQIHDVDFGADLPIDYPKKYESFMIMCPFCSYDERQYLRNNLGNELSKIKFQRDTLLKAIEIKSLVELDKSVGL